MITRPFFPSPGHTNQCVLSGRFELLALIFVLLSVGNVYGQFNSGSTGADGALDTSTMNCNNYGGIICIIQLPESGVLNYTTVNITLPTVFTRNSRNTSVTILAQGNIVITADSVSVGAPSAYDSAISHGQPGPGGFWGGAGGRNGFGPGGGVVGGDTKGSWVGPLSLTPIVGGSGGANGGCGGGGAITLASSTLITIASGAAIRAEPAPACGGPNGAGNTGAGGAIRVVSNTVTMAGVLSASGTPNGRPGVIRLEATVLHFSGVSNPIAVQSMINPVVVQSSAPRLSISSVGGIAVPTNAGSRFDLIDVLISNTVLDPVPVSISAQNIPTGTQVQVGFVSGSPSGTSTPCNLSGTFANSSCTATISNLNRTGGTYLLATAAFDPPASLAKLNPKGPNQVAKVKLESVFGASPTYVFLRSNGTTIDVTKLSKEFLKEFGM